MSGGGTVGYTEQGPAVAVGSGITIAGGTSYAGQYVDFAVGSGTSSDILTLDKDASPITTNGVVSIVGTSVYLGNGSTAEVVGSVDPVLDGTAGQKLRVNFTSSFSNPSFETADLSGWTAVNSRVDLGATSVAGCVPTDTGVYPGPVANQDNNVPIGAGQMSTTVQNSVVNDGLYALQLESTGITTAQGYDVVHGPAVYSTPFEAASGDTIYFDWRAFAGDDDYHVFGYIVDEDCNQVEVLDATGPGTTSWTTKSTVIPTSGAYRFVFVAGTFDASGGQAAGASLIIDNVRVFGTKATDDVAQQVARKLMYENTSDAPPASRTITVTAQSNGNGAGSGTITVNITGVDDAPTMGSMPTDAYTNTSANDTFTNATGTFTATDPENDALSFSIAGSTPGTGTVDGVTYSESLTGTYGTLYLDGSTGDYVYVPLDSAIEATTLTATDTFPVRASANGLSDTGNYVVTISPAVSVTNAPTDLTGTPGNGSVTWTWTAPTWLGGSSVTGYQIETSLDGTTWTTAIADTGSAATTAVVNGLTNGTLVYARVSAINGTGTSAPSAPASATPATMPGAPHITNIVPGNRTLTVAFTPPTSDGGSAVTGYQFSLDGGVTWSSTFTGSGPITVTDIDNGKVYPIALRAVNAAGEGPASDVVSGSPTAMPVFETGTTSLTLKPGAGTLLLDGAAQKVTISREKGTITLTGADTSVSLRGFTSEGKAIPTDEDGRFLLSEGSYFLAQGEGFRPGTVVDVWLLPDLMLGQVTVGADGTFSARLPLGDSVVPGVYTIQLNGVAPDGGLRTFSVGALVLSDADALAYTGFDLGEMVPWALGLILVGAGALALSRTDVIERLRPKRAVV